MNYSVWKQQLSKPEILAILEQGTICTPFPLIEEIVDKLSIEWDNPNMTFLDPCCGRGAFLFVIKNRLMKYHTEQHIVENMLFGVDLSDKNVAFAKAVLDPEGKYKNNIERNNALTKDWKMKFDVVIGNPPYQDSSTTVKGSRGNLWQRIVNQSLTLVKQDGYVAMVTPDSWIQFRGQLGKTFKKLQFTHMWTNNFVGRFFNVGVSVSAWILQNRQVNESTIIVDEHTEIDFQSVKQVANTSSAGTSILEKVLVDSSMGIQFETDNNNNVSWKNNPDMAHLYGESRTPDRLYRVCHTARIDCYASNRPTDYDSKKVILPLMTRTPRPRYFDGGIGSVSRMSVHYNVPTEQEGMNLVNLLTRKVYQFVCYVTNNRNSTTRDWLRQLPLVDLSHTWTDEELYKHFNLTQEEIDLIESTIK